MSESFGEKEFLSEKGHREFEFVDDVPGVGLI
jgi:hypothetical protein